MADQGKWERLLERTDALLSGHFKLSSGLHSPRYVQCAKALEDPRDAAELGRGLAQLFDDVAVDRVVSPPLGALLIGYEVARALERPFAFPERGDSGEFRFRRGFALRPDERVLVIEDVITTGRTTQELVQALDGCDAHVIGVGAIVYRQGAPTQMSLAIRSLVQLSIPTYESESCPLCAAGEAIEKPGSRGEGA